MYFNSYKIKATEELYVEVLYKNEIIKRIKLDKDTNEVINIDKNGHHNQITITYESIKMTEADCPDKYCMRMFMNYRSYTPIICTNGGVVSKG